MKEIAGETGLAWLAVSLLTFVQLAPMGACLARRKMGYLPLLLAVQFIGYTVAPLITLLRGHSLVPSHTAALLLLVLGSSVIVVFDQFIRGRWLESHSPRHFIRFEVSRPFYFSAVATCVASFWILPALPPTLLRISQHYQFLLSAFLFCSFPRGKWSPNLIPALLFFGSFYSFLTFGNFSYAINIGVIWLIDASLERRRRPWAGVIALIFPFLILHSIKGEFREAVSYQPESSVVDKAGLLIGLLQRKIASPDLGEAMAVAADRAHDESLEKVLANTPHPVPFWNGESYYNFVVQLLPGLFGNGAWNVWNLFGHRYGYLDARDRQTEVVFSYFAEGYFNYGYLGFFLVTLFVAVLFPCVEKLSEIEGERFYSFIFIAFLIPMLSYQTDLASVLVKLIWSSLALLPLEWARRRALLHHQ